VLPLTRRIHFGVAIGVGRDGRGDGEAPAGACRTTVVVTMFVTSFPFKYGDGDRRPHSATRRSRSALPMTDTELRLIAALAMMGLSRRPNTGYSTPAAMGTPRAL